MTKTTVSIDLGERSYDIHIGQKLLEDFKAFVPADIAGRKAFIITDENVTAYARIVQDQLKVGGASLVELLVLPFGEKTKSYERWMECVNWMLSHGIHRNSIIFAVGGGVIGDLSGFAASSVLRGVPFIQVPTTLLSQVDSSVGGKTGINTEYGKNLVGAFYQPLSVVTDIDTLKTLPKRELLAGYAEVVKYGLIWDLAFFDWLDANCAKVLDLDVEAVSYAIKVSCEAKADVVQADEREGGKRALLNLGHTFGHALEAAAGYDGSLLHGEAVSIGMVMAFDLSVQMGLCPQEDASRMRAHLVQAGLPVDASAISANIDDLIDTMRRDKKALDHKMTFILTRGIGQAFVTQDVDEAQVREILECSLKGGSR